MRTTAACLVNAGLPRSTARQALIGKSAEGLGLPGGAGRLAAGDAADFVIWNGDPLDIGNRPTAIAVQGQRIVVGAGDDFTGQRSSPTRCGACSNWSSWSVTERSPKGLLRHSTDDCGRDESNKDHLIVWHL